jgi:hypothetical protein
LARVIKQSDLTNTVGCQAEGVATVCRRATELRRNANRQSDWGEKAVRRVCEYQSFRRAEMGAGQKATERAIVSLKLLNIVDQ